MYLRTKSERFSSRFSKVTVIQTDRQTDIQTDRQSNIQTDRQMRPNALACRIRGWYNDALMTSLLT